MPDWTESMQRTYEYYTVDPGTWRDDKPLNTVKSSSISRDSDTDTLGSATIDVTESFGECYVRTYLVTLQNGIKEKYPLGTHLVQTPSSSFNGKVASVTMDAYTPLLELKEKLPPIGYALLKGDNIMDAAYQIVRENVRAPVVKPKSSSTLSYDFVANTDEDWLSYVSALIANAKYMLDLDEMGRVIFVPKQDTAALQPIWTYNDDNSSILLPDVTIRHDLYDIPNVIEVVYSNGNENLYSRVVNDDPNSPISTVSRGREIPHRISNPTISGLPTQKQLDRFAEQTLRDMSTLEYTITYAHAYCPVRVGDCVRLNYTRAGLNGVKAKVISQSIKCSPSCSVSETAVFTNKLWR